MTIFRTHWSFTAKLLGIFCVRIPPPLTSSSRTLHLSPKVLFLLQWFRIICLFHKTEEPPFPMLKKGTNSLSTQHCPLLLSRACTYMRGHFYYGQTLSTLFTTKKTPYCNNVKKKEIGCIISRLAAINAHLWVWAVQKERQDHTPLLLNFFYLTNGPCTRHLLLAVNTPWYAVHSWRQWSIIDALVY